MVKPSKPDKLHKDKTSSLNRLAGVLPPPSSAACALYSDLANPIHRPRKLPLAMMTMKRRWKMKRKRRKKKPKRNRSKMKRSARWSSKRAH